MPDIVVTLNNLLYIHLMLCYYKIRCCLSDQGVEKIKSRNQNQNKAFTLIELLVVIAVIALLMSILFPALRKAKELAKDTICKTHLRGIGVAMLVYLQENDNRAYNNRSSNMLYWEDVNGQLLSPKDGDAYWGVAYADYAEDPKVFGCPSYQVVAEKIYDVDLDRAKNAGYALNSYFFRDLKAIQQNPGVADDDDRVNNRKVTDVRTPFNFIITQDHVEPRIEGASSGGEQNDMFYIAPGQSVNLRQYRPTTVGGGGGREEYYWGIFRHKKRNTALDNKDFMPARIDKIEKTPNGLSNTLWLDGHVSAIKETIGINIEKRWYTGDRND